MLDSITPLLSKNNFPPILLIFGEEDFLVEEAYKALVEAAVDKDFGELNYDILDGNEISEASLASIARAFPMNAERRVVVVKHFEKVAAALTKSSGKSGSTKSSKASSKSAKSQKDSSLSPLAEYIKNPSESTFLLLLADASELNGLRSALKNPKQKSLGEKKLSSAKFPYKDLLERAEWIEFPRLYDREIPSWLSNRLKKYKREITPDACELIISQAGTSLRDLSNEIEKIVTFTQKETITRDDVADLIGASKTYNIFELQKAVGQYNIRKSITIMLNIMSIDRQEMLIVSMLSRYFITLWKLSELQNTTRDTFELSRSLGVNSFFLPEYSAALEKYTRKRVENALFALREADLALKTSSGDAILVLQRMLTTIMA